MIIVPPRRERCPHVALEAVVVTPESGVFRASMDDAPIKELRGGRGTSRQLLNPDRSGVEDIDLHVNDLKPGSGPGPTHYHKHALNVYLVLDGSIQVTLPSGPVTLGPGELLSISPGVIHQTSNPTEETARFIEIYLPAGDDFHIVDMPDE